MYKYAASETAECPLLHGMRLRTRDAHDQVFHRSAWGRLYVCCVQLLKPVKVENNVESWLSSLLMTLRYSVQINIATAAGDIADEQLRIIDFLHTNLAQVITRFKLLRNIRKLQKTVKVIIPPPRVTKLAFDLLLP